MTISLIHSSKKLISFVNISKVCSHCLRVVYARRRLSGHGHIVACCIGRDTSGQMGRASLLSMRKHTDGTHGRLHKMRCWPMQNVFSCNVRAEARPSNRSESAERQRSIPGLLQAAQRETIDIESKVEFQFDDDAL
jgi:hypothetical protein